jgi:hypothetical protein
MRATATIVASFLPIAERRLHQNTALNKDLGEMRPQLWPL